MKKKILKVTVLRHLVIISTLLFLINMSISIFWLSRSNSNVNSTISSKKAPNLSCEIAWQNNGQIICTEPNDQSNPKICSDGAGGAIITWQDLQYNFEIYAQRINSAGGIEWTNTGKEICGATDQQYYPEICSDGAGGAIITWQDYRDGNSDIYAQRINSNGDVQWTVDGEPICNVEGEQYLPQICGDGAGGAIITWMDKRGGDADIYAQRINSNGDAQWTTQGQLICPISGDQKYPQIISDGVGGAIITWTDERGEDADIYAQRVNASGTLLWYRFIPGDPFPSLFFDIPICTAPKDQVAAKICSDGAEGAIITWMDWRDDWTTGTDIYAQRVNSTGRIRWADNGTIICGLDQNQLTPQICSDGKGGAIITWIDERGEDADIHAQRVNSTGGREWFYYIIGPPTIVIFDIAVCTAAEDQEDPHICSDGAGGAIIIWCDNRDDNWDLYAQRINSKGIYQWKHNGIEICTIVNSQKNPNSIEQPEIISDGAGGVIITWQDRRTAHFDIYAQRVKNSPPTSSHPIYVQTTLNGSETINWTLYDDSEGGQYRVLVEDTNGNNYVWKDWAAWTNNTALNVPINRTTTGLFNYTIEYYDDQNAFGIPDLVVVNITEHNGISGISGYNILILFISGLTIFVIIKRKLKMKGMSLNSN